MNQKNKELAISICKLLYDKKSMDVQAIYVGDKTIVADWFVVASGHSTTQIKALCDELEDKAAEMGLTLRRKEGYGEARWIVLDFADILVHIFHPEERKYYNMERLWMGDPCDFIDYSQEMESE